MDSLPFFSAPADVFKELGLVADCRVVLRLQSPQALPQPAGGGRGRGRGRGRTAPSGSLRLMPVVELAVLDQGMAGQRRPRACTECGATSTALWRRPPQGKEHTLCDECGKRAWQAHQRTGGSQPSSQQAQQAQQDQEAQGSQGSAGERGQAQQEGQQGQRDQSSSQGQAKPPEPGQQQQGQQGQPDGGGSGGGGGPDGGDGGQGAPEPPACTHCGAGCTAKKNYK